MKVTKQFGIKKKADDDWFDAILTVDTPLFVDPFLIFKEKKAPWSDAHSQIIKHFEQAFLLIAEGNLNPKTIAYRKALALLLFKEPKEFCLGYTRKGTGGAGGGNGIARLVADAISQAVKRGLKHPKHFEEIGVLNEGIGPDKISDLTLTILKERLISYTQQIAKRHKMPRRKHLVNAASFDPLRKRWVSQDISLPTNPFTDGPLILVPERFLDELPVLNADDWWEYYEMNQLKDDLNYEIMGKVNKSTIIDIARKNPTIVRNWTEAREKEKAEPYDFKRDPAGLVGWFEAAAEFTAKNPLVFRSPNSEGEFEKTINSVLDHFKLFVEEQGGWHLLWNEDGKEKRESAPQMLFKGIASNYCKSNNISLDAEVNLGRGPVDFKFSNGYERRAHLEIKKVTNGRFWEGLEKQLPSYMKSDEVVDGWFLAVHYRDSGVSKNRVKDLPSVVGRAAKSTGLKLRYTVVDARPKISASKL